MSSNGGQSFLPSLKPGPRDRGRQPQTARAAVQVHKVDPPARLSFSENPRSAREHQAAKEDGVQEEDSLDTGHFNVSTSTVASCPALQITAQEWGSSAALLMQGDIIRNHRLKSQLSRLRLSDFFNCHGGPHFKKLSISFAAKQNALVGHTFGSTSNLHQEAELPEMRSSERFPEQGHKALLDDVNDETNLLGSSKAFLAASEARARDLLITQQKAELLLLEVHDDERLRTSEVDERRLSLLFAEIPNFDDVLPKAVNMMSLVPPDLLDEQESAEKQSIERQNSHLADNNFIEGSQMCWMFTQGEVLVMSKCLHRWCVSTRGSSVLGMDRPTFCRMLFELELVDQVNVPYFWAVALFDSLAQPSRICPPGAHHAPTAPIQPIVNKFRLISLLDVIARQHYESINRFEFLDRMKQRAKKLRFYDDAYVAGMTKTNHESKSDQKEETDAKEKGSQERRASQDRRESTDEHQERAKKEPHTKVWKSVVVRDLACRERLVTSMLIEPEVLHVVHCYRDIFAILFDCYAPSGQMQWMDFWQFCVDFQISPQLVTEQQLRKAFETAECLRLLPPRHALPEAPKARRRGAESTPSKGRARKEKGTVSSPTPHGKPKTVSASPDPSFYSAGKDENEKFKGTDSTISSASSPDEAESLECDTAFEVPAFTETLCRITFMYLGFYGNTVQQSSCSLYKISWLIAYLRFVTIQIHDSLDESEAAAAEGLQGAWAVLRKLPLSQWTEPPRQKLTGRTFLQPHAGPGNKKVLRRRGKQQPMAPRLLPGRCTREAAMNLNRQKTRNSVRDAVRQLGKASMVVRAMNDETKVPVKKMDSSSDEELPSRVQTAGTTGTRHSSDRGSARATPQAASRSCLDPDALTRHVASSFKPVVREPPSTLLPVEDLLNSEAGRPAVDSGRCQLCDRTCPAELDVQRDRCSWANPGCRGCSVVDAMKLDEHLFAKLILPDPAPQSNLKVLRPKAKPLVGSRLRPTFVGPELGAFRFATVSESLSLLH